jgi:hypothetical protein
MAEKKSRLPPNGIMKCRVWKFEVPRFLTYGGKGLVVCLKHPFYKGHIPTHLTHLPPQPNTSIISPIPCTCTMKLGAFSFSASRRRLGMISWTPW